MARENRTNLWDAIFHPTKEPVNAPKKEQESPQQALPETEAQRKDKILAMATGKMSKNLRGEYLEAIKLLQSISGWKDADQLLIQCQEALTQRESAESLERQRYAQKQEKDRLFVGKVVAAVAVFLILALIVGAVVVYRNATTNNSYKRIIRLINDGSYTAANQLIQDWSAREDLTDAVRNVIYKAGDLYLEKGLHQHAYTCYSTLGDYKDSPEKADALVAKRPSLLISSIKAGSVLLLGTYLQEKDGAAWNTKEKIPWLVLEVNGTQALVISRDILDIEAYGDPAWTYSDIRSWLQNRFYLWSFSDTEKNCIGSSYISSYAYERVILLDAEAVATYFPTEAQRKCAATSFARERGAVNNTWLLRSNNESDVPYVDSDGIIHYEGWSTNTPCGIRPVMTINLSTLLRLYGKNAVQ